MLRQGSVTLDSVSYRELTELALEVASEAGALILPGWRTHPHASEKNARDLVTEYDIESEALIVDRLRTRTPDIPVVAEEAGGLGGPGATWYCDPLDGTTNFVHGHPFWAVSIGLLEAGIPTVGAVVAPSLGLQWTGYRGGPATRNADACRVSVTQKLGEALLATGFPPKRDREPDSNLATFVGVMGDVRGIRRCGSAAIDLCFVADGTYDAYWERRLNAWDLTGGATVVLSAGGRLSALDGARPDLLRGNLLASNGHVHDAVLELLAPHVSA